MVVEAWPTEFRATVAKVAPLLAKTTLPVGTALAEAMIAITVTGVCKATGVEERESFAIVGVATTV